MKGLKCLIYLVILLAFVMNVNALYISNESCENESGTWIIPNIESNDPNNLGNKPQPYCQCKMGFKFVDDSCVKILKQELCQASGGQWNENNCECPPDSIGWKEGFGCDYKRVLVQSIDNTNKSNNSTNIKRVSLLPSLIILIIVILIGTFYKFLKKWRINKK